MKCTTYYVRIVLRGGGGGKERSGKPGRALVKILAFRFMKEFSVNLLKA